MSKTNKTNKIKVVAYVMSGVVAMTLMGVVGASVRKAQAQGLGDNETVMVHGEAEE